MGLKKQLLNIVTFGASGKIEDRHNKYMEVYSHAEKVHEEFDTELEIALSCLSKLAFQRVLAAEQLTSLQEEYAKLKNKFPELNYFNNGYLIWSNPISVKFTFEEIALNTIKSVSSGVLVSLSLITHSFVQGVMTAKLTAVLGSTKLAAVSAVLNTHTFIASLGLSKMGAITAAGSLKASGVGLAGKAALGSVFPLAIPFILAGMALLNHKHANKKIEEINIAEKKLNECIEEDKKRIVKCKEIEAGCTDKLSSLESLQSAIPELFENFKEASKETFLDKKTSTKFWMKICLLLRLKHKHLSNLRQRKLDLLDNVKQIHQLIKMAVV